MVEPMYQRIAGDLKQQIESGVIAPGKQLPTELDLRTDYNAARNTVRDAIRLLANQGLVETRPGLGTFVIRRLEPFVTTLSATLAPASAELGLVGGEGESAFAEIRARGRMPSGSTPKVSVRPAAELITSGLPAAELIVTGLRVPPGTQVVGRQQDRYIDDMPWSVQASYYPFEFVTRGAAELVRPESLPGGTSSYLEQRLGLVQVGYRERILVRLPTNEEARFFDLLGAERISVVAIVRASYCAADGGPAPFRVTVTVLPADRNQLDLSSGAVPDEFTAPAVA
jgi:GntR family transcriptional regulator